MVARSRYGQLLGHALTHWPTLLVLVVLSIASSAVIALQPWPLKILIDYGLGDQEVPAGVVALLQEVSLMPTAEMLIIAAAIASLGFFLLSSALDVGLTWTSSGLGQRMVFDLAARVFDRLQRLSLLFHAERSVGDSLNRFSVNTYCVYSLVYGFFITPVRNVLILVAVGVVAWGMDPVMTLVALSVAPIMAASALYFGPRLKRRQKHHHVAQSRVMSFVHQTLTALPVVQAFATEGRNQQQFQHLAQDVVVRFQRGNLLMSSYNLMNGLITTCGHAVVLFVGGQRVLSGSLTVGGLVVFMAYVQSLQGAFRELLGIYGSLKAAEAGMDRVFEILESEERVPELPGAVALPIGTQGQRGHISFERVTFGYRADQPVLSYINLDVRRGETIALVGPTGAGKTTLVSLIPRFFDPWEGRVTFDGVDLRQLRLQDLRQQIALMLQEPFLLPLTVAENIAYGRPGASREEVVAAAVAANADEFIGRLPQGYDTPIGERGATLSGGQRQRLAIARALLKDAPVLILDEPTAALDARTEGVLLEALARLMAGRTTFVVAHRLSTIRNADRIVVMKAGRLVEVGTHEELFSLGGEYHYLYSTQQLMSEHRVVA